MDEKVMSKLIKTAKEYLDKGLITRDVHDKLVADFKALGVADSKDTQVKPIDLLGDWMALAELKSKEDKAKIKRKKVAGMNENMVNDFDDREEYHYNPKDEIDVNELLGLYNERDEIEREMRIVVAEKYE